jgi:ubiquinone/menaquinone biosynthesis C-methylase UbiE
MLTEHGSWGFTASTGLDFTHATIVDAHFQACLPSYTRLLHEARIRPGWRVLDAGCGTGCFLPLLARLAGPHGRLAAIDLAPENLALARRRADACRPCPVEVTQGDVTRLPYGGGTFDSVWCANTVQYLNDGELRDALAELRRVLRPGGTIAIKEIDVSTVTVRPGDPFLFADFFRRAGREPGYGRRLLRSRDLYRHLAEAGFEDVRQITVLSEHFAPLTPAERAFYGPSCAQIARQARRLGVPGEWDRFLDPDGPGNPLNDQHGYICEGNVLATGTAPMSIRPPDRHT